MTAALRPATVADVPAIVRLFGAFFPPPEGGWDDRRRSYIELRHRRSIESDPDGAFVVEDAGGLAGVALAIRREGIWVLSLLGVHPEAQGRGLGRLLFDASLRAGEGCRGFMIAASERAQAIALYTRAGFRVHPAMYAEGEPRKDRLPPAGGVREGTAADVAGHCSEIDRAVRGGARPQDLDTLLEMGFRLYVTDGGYAFAGEDGLRTLVAREESEAVALLSRVLAEGEGSVHVDWLDGRQDWAFRVVVEAGLTLKPSGPYLTKGELGPLHPWLPHGALL